MKHNIEKSVTFMFRISFDKVFIVGILATKIYNVHTYIAIHDFGSHFCAGHFVQGHQNQTLSYSITNIKSPLIPQ